jgi:hypothetical protein
MNTIEFTHTGTELPEPARYFPPSRGTYDVGPNLYAFGTDFGNGTADRRVFQVDRDFAAYRQTKLQSRGEQLDKYYRIERYGVNQGEAVARFIVRQLTLDYPAWFRRDGNDEAPILDCTLTGERLRFDSHMKLVAAEGHGETIHPPYVSALDALASQVQEDMAVISLDGRGHEWACALHVCYPNHWSVEEKIGRSFAAIHEPVAGMERIRQRAGSLTAAMIHKGPYVRFGWGLASDARLNHHPVAPAGESPELWHGRQFDPQQARLFLRMERQVIWGFPKVSAALFLIRTFHMDVSHAEPAMRVQLARAVESMTPEQLRYKGLDRPAILASLKV